MKRVREHDIHEAAMKGFDPKNPEDFEYIPYYFVSKLTKKEQKFYKAGFAKYEVWKKAETKKQRQAPRDFSEADNRTHAENKMILKLGNALKEEGYEIVYCAEGFYGKPEYEIHESWAVRGIIKKNGKEVGNYTSWTKGTGWSYKPLGYEIYTNRGKGSRPDSYSDTKRVKLVDSAVKYVKETAIPEADWENELKKANDTLASMRREAVIMRKRAQDCRNGITRPYRDKAEADGTLSAMMDAFEERSSDLEGALKCWEIMTQKVKEYQALVDQIAEAEEAADKYAEETVIPLRETARKELPEVYS